MNRRTTSSQRRGKGRTLTTVQAVLDEVRKQPGTGDVIPVFDPSTEEQIAEFTDCGFDAVIDGYLQTKIVWAQR